MVPVEAALFACRAGCADVEGAADPAPIVPDGGNKGDVDVPALAPLLLKLLLAVLDQIIFLPATACMFAVAGVVVCPPEAGVIWGRLF